MKIKAHLLVKLRKLKRRDRLVLALSSHAAVLREWDRLVNAQDREVWGFSNMA